MKNTAIIFILFLFSLDAAAQNTPVKRPSSPKTVSAKAVAVPTPVPADPIAEKARLDDVIAANAPAERAVQLKAFITNYPNSNQKARAIEALVVAYAALGDEKLSINDSGEGVAFFKLAADAVPKPIPARLFAEVVSKFPANLYYRGQRSAAVEIASVIENKSEGNPTQLLALAAFYLAIEDGGEAKHLAAAATVLAPKSVTAYQTLGLAHRLNFDLEESAKAYEKALELEPESSSARRSLAEMKRALGKTDEAAALYREVLGKYENDIPARTGLILSLFDAGKKAEAETELAKSLEQVPNNLNLLAGAAYWYAANDQGDKAVEFAQKAVDLEPRFIWSHIALARGLMIQKKPIDAERVLIRARQYGNFPTLEYEISSARLMSGFYREAVEELQKSFFIKNGLIHTKLGGRVLREDSSFTDLIASERRASIFEPHAAENAENALKLKVLFEMSQKLDVAAPIEADILLLADEFVKGDDKMKIHRQLYTATVLLQKKIAVEKAAELVKASVGNIDAGLDVAAPAAAVMANELYESRTIAFVRNELVVVPDVPRQTLSAILRGRIEELQGWTLYQQNHYPEAIIRFRRAISVLPDKSAWWRSSVWRLGAALEADGKEKEALDNYIQSYKTSKPDVGKYFVVENLYRKLNGGIEGLEARIGPNPLPSIIVSKPVEPPIKISKTVPVKNIDPLVKEATNDDSKSEKVISKIETAEQKTVDAASNNMPIEPTAQPVLPQVEPAVQNEKTSISSAAADLTIQSEASKTEISKERSSETVENSETVPVQEMPKIEIPKEPVAEKIIQPVEPQPDREKPVIEIPKELFATSVINPEPTPLFALEPEKKTVEDPKPNDLAKTSVAEIRKLVIPETHITKTDPIPSPDTTANSSPAEKKPLDKSQDIFEPILISIPKASTDANEPNAKTTFKVFIDDPIATGASRPRVITGKDITSAPRFCSINVSQENISILNDGGSVGILVGLDGDGDVNEISAISNSPKDIEVKLEPAIGGTNRFYVIRSVGTAPGMYHVTFEAPCDKKEILVRVR